jgi:putative (di)nucleoside polyphosphate hydrolase
MPPFESLSYRRCVGMTVLNRTGLAFIGRRVDGPEHTDNVHVWQMPQGDIPREIVGQAWNGKYRGQKQKWYALRFTGDDSEIDIEHPAGGHKPEFVEWRWEELQNLPELVVPFKRQVYERVVAEFAKFA